MTEIQSASSTLSRACPLPSLAPIQHDLAGHFQRDIETFFHPELLHRLGHFFSVHIQCEIGTHFSRQIETIRIHVGDDHVTCTGSFANWNGHSTDRAGAGDEDIFADQIERERSVHSVAERIETRKHIQRDRRISVPAVVLRNRYELRPRAGTIDANALRVWAKMSASG